MREKLLVDLGVNRGAIVIAIVVRGRNVELRVDGRLGDLRLFENLLERRLHVIQTAAHRTMPTHDQLRTRLLLLLLLLLLLSTTTLTPTITTNYTVY